LLKLYLDSSVLLKRYVTESGTEITDEIFDRAEAGELTIVVSLWNIGEALGVLDERRRRGWLSRKEFAQALESFVGEIVKLMELKTLEVIPVHTPILTEAWDTVMTRHIYEADALQISTCNYSKSNALISADGKLCEASNEAGVKAFHITEDEKLRQLIQNACFK